MKRKSIVIKTMHCKFLKIRNRYENDTKEMNTIRNKWNKYNKNTIYNTKIKIMQLKKIDIYNWKKNQTSNL